MFAACSGGGSTMAPATATNSSSSVGRKPNSVLTLQFPKNLVSLKKSSSTTRKPKYVDPDPTSVLYVTAYPSSGAAETVLSGVPLSSGTTDALGDVSIPLYLPPGYDEILVQQFLSFGGPSSGYLLAQGDVTDVFVGENATNTPSIPMTLVLGARDQQSGIAVVNDYLNTTNSAPLSTSVGTQSTYYVGGCGSSNNGGTVFFLPVDEEGTSAYSSGTSIGAYTGGIPVPVNVSPVSTIAPTSETGSILVPSINGGYTIAFDSNFDPIEVSVTFQNVLVDSGSIFGALGTTASYTGYVQISEGGC
jgi:hypothetical protein